MSSEQNSGTGTLAAISAPDGANPIPSAAISQLIPYIFLGWRRDAL